MEADTLEKNPDEQSAQVVAPKDPENVPMPHEMQSVSSSLPADAKYLPAVHDVQADCPADNEYLPAAHSEHPEAPVCAEYVPAVHRLQLVAVWIVLMQQVEWSGHGLPVGHPTAPRL